MTDIKAIGTQSFILPGFVANQTEQLLQLIDSITRLSPLRHMTTPGGFEMKAQLSNCGDWGWVTDRKGYRYQATDPLSQQPWPPMPELIATLATEAAAECDYASFNPDVCLINCYHPGAGMGLHQDKDERDFSQPIVSISLGVPAIFFFGGLKRSEKPAAHLLVHGDVVVWGGEDRLRFHGIKPLKLSHHPDTGQLRYNLTLRRAK